MLNKRVVMFIFIIGFIQILLISSVKAQQISFIRGDSNNDAKVDISDPVFILQYLFKDGQAPSCEKAADANDDGSVDLADAVKILSFLFLGEKIPFPNPSRGFDVTQDQLTCKCNSEKECLNKIDFNNNNIVFVKISHKDIGFNPNLDFKNFGQDEIAPKIEHFKKTIAWLTNNKELKINTNYLEYNVDYNHDAFQTNFLTPLSQVDYDKIVQIASTYNPRLVVIIFESATNAALGEQRVGNLRFNAIQVNALRATPLG